MIHYCLLNTSTMQYSTVEMGSTNRAEPGPGRAEVFTDLLLKWAV